VGREGVGRTGHCVEHKVGQFAEGTYCLLHQLMLGHHGAGKFVSKITALGMILLSLLKVLSCNTVTHFMSQQICTELMCGMLCVSSV